MTPGQIPYPLWDSKTHRKRLLNCVVPPVAIFSFFRPVICQVRCNIAYFMLPDSNTNVNSMISRRVSLFYQYRLEISHHVVCPYTLYSACVLCPGTCELVGQHPPPISMSASENGGCQPGNKQEQE